MEGVSSVELSTMRICAVTPARWMPSLHQSTNSPTVIRSFSAGTTILRSTSPSVAFSGSKCRILGDSLMAQFLPHCLKRSLHRLAGAALALPSQAGDLRRIKAHDGDVAFPPTISAGKFEGDIFQSGDFHREIRDFTDGDIVARGDIEDIVDAAVARISKKDGIEDIRDMDVAFALTAVAE